jgi:hypothetical protein
MAWLQQQPTRERPNTLRQAVHVKSDESCKSGTDHTFFIGCSAKWPGFPEEGTYRNVEKLLPSGILKAKFDKYHKPSVKNLTKYFLDD